MASAWGLSFGDAWGNSWGGGGTTPDPTPVQKPHGTPWWVRQFLIDLKKKKKRNEALARLLVLLD